MRRDFSCTSKESQNFANGELEMPLTPEKMTKYEIEKNT